jgi:thiamine-phosphate pyrophosphorylase
LTLPDPPLLVITDRHQARRPIEDMARAIFAGGCRWLSLREKDLDGTTRLILLRRLVAIGQRYGASVTVHADVDAALAAGAAGVHLPSDVSPVGARGRLGKAALIGCSVHNEAALTRAAERGADYATLSPIYPSASKPGYGPPLGLDRLARAAAATTLPVIALGGIDETNAARCLDAGAAGLAVMGEVMRAADPAGMLTRLIRVVRDQLAGRGSGRDSGLAERSGDAKRGGDVT